MIALGMRRAWVLGLVLACASSSVGAFTRVGPVPASEPRDPPPGEGVLCAWAFTSAAASIGRQCGAVRNAEFQAELERSVGRFEAYARDAGWTPAQIAEFERQQGQLEPNNAGVCTGEMTGLYTHMSAGGPNVLRSGVDRLVSRPGRPSWGDCA